MRIYMLLDENNVIVNCITLAQDHQEDLNEFVNVTASAVSIVEIENLNSYYSVGATYNPETKKVRPLQTYPSWIWDEVEERWICPVPIPENPENHVYKWDEDSQQWNFIMASTINTDL
jgi:hypothetical protein